MPNEPYSSFSSRTGYLAAYTGLLQIIILIPLYLILVGPDLALILSALIGLSMLGIGVALLKRDPNTREFGWKLLWSAPNVPVRERLGIVLIGLGPAIGSVAVLRSIRTGAPVEI